MTLGAHLKLYKPVIRRDAGVKTAFSASDSRIMLQISHFTFKHIRLFSRTINRFF